MSEEEDKSTLNDVDNASANRPNDSENDTQSDSLLVNGNANATPCQLDIGLGTHTDSRRNDNSSNVNGKYIHFSHLFIKCHLNQVLFTNSYLKHLMCSVILDFFFKHKVT